MTRHHDLTGNRYGRLCAIERLPNNGKHTVWQWKCDCGATKAIESRGVLYGAVNSCGCLRREANETGLHRLQHGDAKNGQVTRLHNIWRGMKKRCRIGAVHHSGSYAERGITVCDAWSIDYAVFKKWALESGYRDDLSIDRIDNDRGYGPDNCRWATASEQARNRRNSRP